MRGSSQPVDMPFVHQLQQLALAHHRVAEVEAGEFDLLRMEDAQLLEEPVVEGPVVLELEGADRMGDPLEGVGQAVGEIVHRVDAPRVPGAVMGGVEDAVDHRVAQVHVRRGHVDLGPQHPAAVRELAGAHAPEQIQVLLHAAVAEGALFAGFGQGAAVVADLLGVQAVNVGLAGPDQVNGELVEPIEVVRGVAELLPVEPQPAHILLDRLGILLLFPGGVGIVHAQVTAAGEFGGQAEIETDRFGVADMQIAVGLGGKAGQNPSAMFFGLDVFGDERTNKIGRRGRPRL